MENLIDLKTNQASAGQIKNIPDIVSGAAGLAADTGLGITNYLLGTDFKRGKKDFKLCSFKTNCPLGYCPCLWLQRGNNRRNK